MTSLIEPSTQASSATDQNKPPLGIHRINHLLTIAIDVDIFLIYRSLEFIDRISNIKLRNDMSSAQWKKTHSKETPK